MGFKKIPIYYIGWVGNQNLGDDASYRVIQSIFSKYQFILSDQKFAENMKNFHNIYPQICFFGGGTLLPHFTVTVKPMKYNYAFGVGVRNPSFWGRFDSLIIDRMRSFEFRFLGVRDNVSKALLERWELKSEVIGDPCLNLGVGLHKKRYEKRVAINIGSDGLLWGGNEEKVLKEVSKFTKTLKTKGYQVTLIPFWRENVPYIRKLAALSGAEIFKEWFNFDSVLEFISTCKVLIGEKLHSLIFSAAVGTPFICLEYRPKCFAFSESVGFTEYCIRTDEITADKILMKFEGLLANYKKMQRELIRKVEKLREKQRNFAIQIMNDIDSLPDGEPLKRNKLVKIRDKMLWNIDVFLNSNFFNVWKCWNKLFFLHMICYLK